MMRLVTFSLLIEKVPGTSSETPLLSEIDEATVSASARTVAAQRPIAFVVPVVRFVMLALVAPICVATVCPSMMILSAEMVTVLPPLLIAAVMLAALMLAFSPLPSTTRPMRSACTFSFDCHMLTLSVE